MIVIGWYVGGGRMSVTKPKGGKQLHLKTSPHPRVICVFFPLVLPPGLRLPGLPDPGRNRAALKDSQQTYSRLQIPQVGSWGVHWPLLGASVFCCSFVYSFIQ